MITINAATTPQLAGVGAAVVATILEATGEELAGNIARELITKFGAAWMRGHLDAFDLAELGSLTAEAAKFK